MLRTQLGILREPEIVNPFESTDSNVEEAYPPAMELVDSDQEGDSDIEVEWILESRWKSTEKDNDYSQ